MDNDSGNDEGGDDEEDWQGWRSETRCLFQRWGYACGNERFV